MNKSKPQRQESYICPSCGEECWRYDGKTYPQAFQLFTACPKTGEAYRLERVDGKLVASK